jgi:hypothetical protein
MLGVSIRITTDTRKELETTLGRAFKAGDLGMVRRVTALLGIASGWLRSSRPGPRRPAFRPAAGTRC